jgi:hypothetical protein
MKNIKSYQEFSLIESKNVIELNRPWTQRLQRAFDVCQDVHDCWDVELDRTDDENIKLVGGSKEHRELVQQYLFNSGLGAEMFNESVDRFKDWKKFNQYTIRYKDGGYVIYKNRKQTGEVFKSIELADNTLKNKFERDKEWN